MEPDVRERFERLETNLSTLVGVVTTLADVAKSHEERLHEMAKRMDTLAVSQVETQEELGALIRMMDEWIRNNPRNGKSAG